MSRSPHPRVVARADPHPSTFSPPTNVSFHPLRTKRARTCVHACVRAYVRACTRAHACLPGPVLKGRMCARRARVDAYVRVQCVYMCLRVEQVYACSFPSSPSFSVFFFFYRRSVSLFSLPISFLLSFPFSLCVSIFFSVEKAARKGPLEGHWTFWLRVERAPGL